MPAQTNTYAEHMPTRCASEDAWNEPSAGPATYFQDDIGFDSSTGGVDIGFAATGFQDTTGFVPAQSYHVRPGAAGSQGPFTTNPWFEQQFFSSAVFANQAADQVPAGNGDGFVPNPSKFASHQVNHPQDPMLVKSDILTGANASGTTVSPRSKRSGVSKTVVCQEVYDDFFENGIVVQDSHNLSSTNEHVLTGSSLLAAYTVKNTFIDFRIQNQAVCVLRQGSFAQTNQCRSLCSMTQTCN